jgi:hypothetical protein
MIGPNILLQLTCLARSLDPCDLEIGHDTTGGIGTSSCSAVDSRPLNQNKTRLVIHEKSHSSSCSQGSQIGDIGVELCLPIAQDSQALKSLNSSNCGLWAPLCNLKRG